MSRWSIKRGDCLDVMPTLREQSVDCVVTSPPYHGLRQYLPKNHKLADREIGREGSIDRYIEVMLRVSEQVQRLLKPRGTFWVVIGDQFGRSLSCLKDRQRVRFGLAGVPWRLAFAMQDAGWMLVDEIVWRKSNPGPMPIKNHTLRVHESIFVFSRSPRPYFDADAASTWSADFGHVLPRSVWTTAKDQSSGHRAGYPLELARDMVAIACPPTVCGACGAPHERGKSERDRNEEYTKRATGRDKWRDEQGDSFSVQTPNYLGKRVRSEQFSPTCDCRANAKLGRVLDPFCGSGTTLLAAQLLGRDSIGIELNPVFHKAAYTRLRTGGQAGKITDRQEAEGGLFQ